MSKPKNIELEKKILILIKDGEYAGKIAKFLKINKSTVSRKIAKFLKDGLLEKQGKYPAFYKLTESGKKFLNVKVALSPSLGVRPPISRRKASPLLKGDIRLHAFKVKIPIKQHGKLKKPKITQVKNWYKQFLPLDVADGIKLEITTRSAIIHFKATNIKKSKGIRAAIAEFSNRGVVGTEKFLKRSGYELESEKMEVIDQHISQKTAEEVDEQVAKGTVFKEYLGRKARTITGFMGQDAAAWVDKSEGTLEIETNDLIYEELLLQMPLTVAKLKVGLRAIEKYDTNISKHLGVLDEMSQTLKDIREALDTLSKK